MGVKCEPRENTICDKKKTILADSGEQLFDYGYFYKMENRKIPLETHELKQIKAI